MEPKPSSVKRTRAGRQRDSDIIPPTTTPETQHVQLSVSKGRRVVLWLIFVGLVAVLSSLVTGVIGYINGNTPSVTDLLAEGDGFLVAIAITADAYGRAVEREQAHTLPAIGCAILLAAALVAFGYTKTQLQNHREEIAIQVNDIRKLPPDEALRRLVSVLEKHPYKNERVFNLSVVLVVLALLTSFTVIMRLEE
jgi:hypothetical protein